MLNNLRLYWLEKITYTRVLAEPDFDAGTLPPVIAPALRADVIQNTEADKKSVYLSAKADGKQPLSKLCNHHAIEYQNKTLANRPFPSCLLTLFQNESWCTTFQTEMSYTCTIIV